MTQEQLNKAKKLRELTDIYLRIFERFEEAKGDKDISEFLCKFFTGMGNIGTVTIKEQMAKYAYEHLRQITSDKISELTKEFDEL